MTDDGVSLSGESSSIMCVSTICFYGQNNAETVSKCMKVPE